MRVIGGEFRGRPLRAPRGGRIRPTQGHVRQVLFDVLGPSIQGARVLDLFAGSGAVGLEALSRGAETVTFVEKSPGSLRCLRANVSALDVQDRCRILAAPVEVGLRILNEAGATFGILFADPPYRSRPRDWMGKTAKRGPGGLLASDGLLILEASRRTDSLEAVGDLVRARRHRVGETVLEFYRWGE
ncbi:MAG: 16S rRNA (guanine(966)-N(2))-methyltransferase RsmD, partial [Candidatus Eisenbacteria bacterium]|nr:16S rRNA (guanine(966)-N(2))-methyltransferase RsmD [Candidatus Latescibacterota bacterium]MBD3301637.1 16S rRNA (guanine(966)-N(2))-methyltransferase RsmD [Candidatus Eisenbacteria bacterium]